jgi:hypothetical protein
MEGGNPRGAPHGQHTSGAVLICAPGGKHAHFLAELELERPVAVGFIDLGMPRPD